MYEYVGPSKYVPIRKDVEQNLFQKANWYLDVKYCFKFNANLIGSAGRHVVTRIKNSNEGFDLDFDLIIPKSVSKILSPKEIKDAFMNAFNCAVGGTLWEYPRNSTSVITIPHRTSEGEKECSIDLAIVFDDGAGRHCLKVDKTKIPHGYSFEIRPHSSNLHKKVKVIKSKKMMKQVRNEYLKRKNDSKYSDKPSRLIYSEVINDIYNHIQQIKNNNSKSNGKR